MPKKTQWGNFRPAPTVAPFRLILRSYGAEKTGKDHFGLTGPAPVAIQSFDIGLEGVVEKFSHPPLGPKEVVYTEYEFDRNNCTQDAAVEIKERFVKDFDLALVEARTIIWDTETEFWELCRYAEFGENEQGISTDQPRNYTKLNAFYRDLIQKAYDSGVNLQLIQKVKEKWGIDKRGNLAALGEYRAQGFKEAGYIVQVSLLHRWDSHAVGIDENFAEGFVVDVENCRQNMQLTGSSHQNIDWATLGQLVFADSAEKDWQ